MNELAVLKELNQLMNEGKLPKQLLEKVAVKATDIEDVVLSYDSGKLEVGIIFDNSYDASRVVYVPFDEVIKYLPVS